MVEREIQTDRELVRLSGAVAQVLCFTITTVAPLNGKAGLPRIPQRDDMLALQMNVIITKHLVC